MTNTDRNKNVLLALGRYNPRFHYGVARFAVEHGWHLNSQMAYFGRPPRNWKGDGIITLLDSGEELVDYVMAAQVPAVDLSVIRLDVVLPRVSGDHYEIGCVAAEHFLERGFRHFAWFTSNDDRVSRLRWQGFRETLARSGFTSLCWLFQPAKDNGYDEWSAKREFLKKRLKEIPKPAAVFCYWDDDAVCVLDACADADLAVPEETAILGTDINPLVGETVRVPLSSVNHDTEAVGYKGAELLGLLMQGQHVPKRPTLIPPKGVTLRRSTEVLALNHEPTRRAVEFLRSNYRRRIGAEEAAAAVGLPRWKLERAFLSHLGRSVHAYLSMLRLARAKDLLLDTALSVTNVSIEAGFNTPQYFNNVFRKATGLTPRQFRLRGKLGSEDGSLMTMPSLSA